MADPYLAEIRMFTGNFAPSGWAQCNGQIMAISQNTALFSLLGTNFGGNGTSNFGLPNLQGAVPMGQGNGLGLTPRTVGEVGGTPSVTLLSNELASHTHLFQGVDAIGTVTTPGGNLVAEQATLRPYSSPATTQPMSANAIGSAGGSQPHNNMQPYLGLTFIIALSGIFPPRG